MTGALVMNGKPGDAGVDFAFDLAVAGIVEVAVALLEFHLHEARVEIILGNQRIKIVDKHCSQAFRYHFGLFARHTRRLKPMCVFQ